MKEIDPEFPGSTLAVDLGPASYPIYIGYDILSCFGGLYVRHCGQRRAVVITDDNIEPLYAEVICQSLRESHVEGSVVTVEHGEKSKRMEVVESVYDQLFELEIERSDGIVALGGGVVGDLAGFIAATFKRGISYVQAPTSLLAMVDSSIGGKTGINHPRGKNMIGAFYQPKMVFADTGVLKTLPRRELGCGLAETVKHAVIRDGAFFDHLEANAEQILKLDQHLMVELVERNCRIKAAVVAADEREAGLRGILNLGHTIGHTLETVLADDDYHHGEAVSLGMVAAARLARGRGFLAEEQIARIVALLQRFDLPTSIAEKNHLTAKYAAGDSAAGGAIREPAPLPVDDLYKAMKQDKKVKSGKIRFVLPITLGDCRFVDDLSEEEIKDAIRTLL